MVSCLGYAPFWNPDEGRYASAALEMSGGVAGGHTDWVVPHLNTISRLNKPPLVYWLGATFFEIFGPHEWAGRLGSALAAVLILFLVFRLGRAMFDESTGIIAALVWSTSLLPAALGRTLNTDMLLCASMALVFYGLWFAALPSENKTFKAFSPYICTGIGMGLAMLAKGPVGVALPLLIGGIFITAAKSWRNLRFVGVLAALAIMATIAAPWFLAIEKQQPGFSYNFIIAENFGRFSGSEGYHDPTPIWYYIPVVIAGMLPWTPFLLTIFTRSNEDASHRRARLFLWLWAGIIVVFFSKSHTKLVSYVLPAFPALALLVADGILRFAGRKTKMGISVCAAMVFFGVAGAIGACVFLLNEKSLPFRDGLPYAAAIAIIFLLCGGFTLRCWCRGRGWRLATAQFVSAALLYVILLAFAGRFSHYEDASAILKSVEPHLEPSDRIVQAGSFVPTAIFYLRRPLVMLNYEDNSGLPEKEWKVSPLFPQNKPTDLTWLFNQPRRVFAIIRWRRDTYSVPANVYTWARNNDFKLISNQPPPTDYRFDFTAPQKAKLDTRLSSGPPPLP